MIRVSLIGDNVDKGYDYLIGSLFNLEETLTSIKYKYFDQFPKFTYVDSVAESVLYANFTKVAPLIILEDGNSL